MGSGVRTRIILYTNSIDEHFHKNSVGNKVTIWNLLRGWQCNLYDEGLNELHANNNKNARNPTVGQDVQLHISGDIVMVSCE